METRSFLKKRAKACDYLDRIGCLRRYSQSYGLSINHVQMWESDHKEAPKNWCFQTAVLEKTFKNSLDNKEIKPVNPKGNQPWIFFGRTDAEAEAPILWPPDVKSWLTEKDPDTGKDWGQEDKVAAEHKRVRANSGRQWRTGKPGMMQSTGSQRVRYDWTTEQQEEINST